VNGNINVNTEILTFLNELNKSIVVTPLKQQDAETDRKAFVLNIFLNLEHLPKF
jgi:hypothetical protein